MVISFLDDSVINNALNHKLPPSPISQLLGVQWIYADLFSIMVFKHPSKLKVFGINKMNASAVKAKNPQIHPKRQSVPTLLVFDLFQRVLSSNIASGDQSSVQYL